MSNAEPAKFDSVRAFARDAVAAIRQRRPSSPLGESASARAATATGHASAAAHSAHGAGWVTGAAQRCRTLLHDALPQLCALCAAPSGRRLLCPPCERSLPRLGPACPHCALPSIDGSACAACLTRPPPWSNALAAYAYAYPLDRLLHAFKYRAALAYGPLFAEALAAQVRHWPEVIVPIPLARRRQRERGYNQAQEIARPLARSLGLPLQAALSRIRETPRLAVLPWRRRGASVCGAFAATGSVRGVAVALVDDVLTTGATMRAATLALLAAGATRVDVWVVARTLPPSP